ncbi:unnamed protein product [Spirodela intermedia]|uniref:Uncharacterized protein n=1 Tax=Spirodela intermedia TaxID=51605 RepID=A0A7I8KQ26_SPIIN|nr:unnamed protein product [Spirodela intermedia]
MENVGDNSSSSVGDPISTREVNLGPSGPRLVIELPAMPAEFKLTGYNLIRWSKYVREVFTGRGVLHHLIEGKPDPLSREFRRWREKDALIKTWFWGTMIPQIGRDFFFLSTVKDMWETVHTKFSQRNNEAHLYELETKSMSTIQGNKSMMEYTGQLKNLWQEIDYYLSIDTEKPAEIVVL